MKRRWSISTDGGIAWVEINPLNVGKLGFTRGRDLNAGQIFFRTKLKAPIMLGGEDYDLLRSIQFDPGTRCNDILLRCDEYCTGWAETWRGVFSTSAGTWDLVNCTCTFKVEPVDRYTCALRRQKLKFNILQVGPQDNITKIVPPVDFLVCEGFDGPPFDDLWCAEIGGDPLNPLNSGGWEYIDDINDTIDGIPTTFYFYWRERITTECVDGLPSPPPGTSWVEYVNDCSTNGTAQFVRPTQGAYPFGSPTQGTYDGDGNPVPPNDTCTWLFVGNVRAFGTTDVFAPYFVCVTDPSDADIELNRGRRLQDVTQFLLDELECDLGDVVSDFFEWNPVGDAIGYVAGENYVTGEANQYSDMLIYQKTDVIGAGGTDPATIGELTFDEMMRFYRVAFRVFWDIDDDGALRLEHWSYFTGDLGLDLALLSGVIEPLVYESLNEAIPASERARWMDAQGRDFVGLDIVYSGPCVNVELDPTEWTPGRFSTDVNYVINVAENLSPDGFVVLACTLVGSTYHTILDVGVITGNFISNAPMSWANLQDAFWRSDRYRPTGRMNGLETEFDDYLPNIEQKGVTIPRCCETLSMDPRARLTTALGERLLPARTAVVETIEDDLLNDVIKLTLRYRY